jgi:tetratricopeptide (TPR) repeat protein
MDVLIKTEKMLNKNDKYVSRSLMDLGGLYYKAGEYNEAKTFISRALTIREKNGGLESVETAESLNDLGVVLDELGEKDVAQSFFRQALEIREKKLGLDHLDTAESLNSVASSLFDSDNFEIALAYFKRCLSIRELKLPPGDPSILSAMFNIGSTYDFLNMKDEAQEIFNKALRVSLEVFGENDLTTVQAYAYRSVFLWHNNIDYELAEIDSRHALAIQENILGSNHPDIAGSLENIAICLKLKGNLMEAEAMYRRAIQIMEKIFGLNHPQLINCLEGIGAVLEKIGNLEDANLFFKRVQSISEVPKKILH